MPRFPEITVQLTGGDANVFAILDRVQRALRQAGEDAAAEEFYTEAIVGDYDHLLRTAMEFRQLRLTMGGNQESCSVRAHHANLMAQGPRPPPRRSNLASADEPCWHANPHRVAMRTK
jgi:hypothetical protein